MLINHSQSTRCMESLPRASLSSGEKQLTVVGFVEGVLGEHVGIIGVPMILSWAAEQGLHTALLVGGHQFPGWEHTAVSHPDCAFSRPQGSGTFATLTSYACTSWRFSLPMLWRYQGLVRSSDFVILKLSLLIPRACGISPRPPSSQALRALAARRAGAFHPPGERSEKVDL